MELKEGMYVRTKWGIAKYIHKAVTKATIYYVVDKKIVYENVEGWEDSLLSNEIIKASNNIIDLIEVGDYVNGYKVYYCYCADEDMTGLFIDTETKRVWLDKPSQIKSIVTKEQFESMKYRVEE